MPKNNLTEAKAYVIRLLKSFEVQKQILYNLVAAIREDSIVELWSEKNPVEKI